MTLAIDFHDSQWPDAVAERLVADLREGQIPGRFLYDSPAQSARWLAYHEAWSPARTDSDVQSRMMPCSTRRSSARRRAICTT